MRVFVRSFIAIDPKGDAVILHLHQQYLPQTASKFWQPDAVPGVKELTRENGDRVEYKSRGIYIDGNTGEALTCGDGDAP